MYIPSLYQGHATHARAFVINTNDKKEIFGISLSVCDGAVSRVTILRNMLNLALRGDKVNIVNSAYFEL
jgi:hypothetical protein